MAKQISTQEIAKHAYENDIWIVVNGKVYDVTKFAPDHPGGAESTMNIPDPRILNSPRLTNCQSYLSFRWPRCISEIQ
jgi:hypothetical protein